MQPNAPLTGAMARAVDLSALKSRAQTPPGAPAGAGGGAPAGGSVVDVTEATFQAEVLERSMQVPVVLDLWAEWCQPCKQLGPILERLAAEGGGSWVLAKIDVDANPTIAQALRVQGIPAVKAVYAGQLVAEFSGALPEPQVREWIKALIEAVGGDLPDVEGPGEAGDPEPPTDPELDAAEARVAAGDLAGAEADLTALVAREPERPGALELLRGVQLQGRVAAAGPDPVGRADAAPDDVALALAAADAQVLGGAPADAFDRLLALLVRVTGDDRNAVRTRLVELFGLLGDDDPLVATARRRLTAALF